MRYMLLALMVAGCPCRNTPVPPVVIPPNDTDDCAAACVRLRSLHCEEGNPLADGTTCETFCVNTQRNGHVLRPSCVRNISACSEVNGCVQ
jgi:hypothetical protein